MTVITIKTAPYVSCQTLLDVLSRLREAGAGGSNPLTPTNTELAKKNKANNDKKNDK